MGRTKQLLSACLTFGLMALALGATRVASAQERTFDLAAAEAAISIPEFARQAGVQIVAPAERLRGVRTPAVRGRFEILDALARLIEGADLEVVSSANGLIVLRQKSKPRHRTDATAAPSIGAADKTATPMARSPPEQPQAAEAVLVTGSRIERAGFDTVQPANVLDVAIADARGMTNTAELINETPSFGTPISNEGGQAAQTVGQNFVNALGLGTARTLVLINGRRVVPQKSAGSFTDPGLQVDLNILPSALIDRIETIYTGGAPLYGSDAIAGTVNVILKRSFQGAMLDGQYGRSEAGDAATARVRGLFGTDFANRRGNAVLALEHSEVDPVHALARRKAAVDYSYCANPANTGPSDGVANEILCADAANFWAFPVSGAPQPMRGDWDGPRGGENAFFDDQGEPLLFSLDGRSLITFDEARLGRPYTAALSQGADGSHNPYIRNNPRTNTLVSQLERTVVGALGDLQFDNGVRAYAEGLFARSTAIDTSNQGPYSAALFPQYGGQLQVRLDNPYVTSGVRSLIETQLRARDLDRDGVADNDPNSLDLDGDGVADTPGIYLNRSYPDLLGDAPTSRKQDVVRTVVGAEGELNVVGMPWTWDASYTFGRTSASTTTQSIIADRLALALDAAVDPESGRVVCRSQLTGESSSADVELCVPFNPLGVLPPDDRSSVRGYLLEDSSTQTRMTQHVIDTNIAGHPIELPAGRVGVAGGLTYRSEQARFTVGPTRALGIGPVQSMSGAFRSREAHMEMLVPVLAADSQWSLPGVKRFELEASLRHVDSSRDDPSLTWTAGARLGFDLPGTQASVTLRGNRTRAIRSPSFAELHTPASVVATMGNDPCDPRFIAGGPTPEVRAANCRAQVASMRSAGMLSADFSLDAFASQIVNVQTPGTISGTPELSDEVSDSWTVGMVFSADASSRLRLAVDWIQIRIEDAIVSLNATQVLASCYDNLDFAGNPACAQFQRQAGTFQVQSPRLGFLNAAERTFAGLVMDMSGEFTPAWLPFLGNAPGRFVLGATAFYTHRHEQSIAGIDRDLLAGERGFERWRWQMNLQYERERMAAMWGVRYVSGGYYDRASGSEARDPGTFHDFIEHDLALRFRASDQIDVRLAVNDVFNHTDDATLIAVKSVNAVQGGANIFQNMIGRSYALGLSVRL